MFISNTLMVGCIRDLIRSYLSVDELFRSCLVSKDWNDLSTTTIYDPVNLCNLDHLQYQRHLGGRFSVPYTVLNSTTRFVNVSVSLTWKLDLKFILQQTRKHVQRLFLCAEKSNFELPTDFEPVLLNNLENCTLSGTDCVSSIASRAPNMKSLSLEHFEPENMPLNSFSHPKLTRLEVFEAFLTLDFFQLQTLRELSLSDCIINLSNVEYAKLEKLDIGHSVKINSRNLEFEDLKRYFPYCQHIALDACNEIIWNELLGNDPFILPDGLTLELYDSLIRFQYDGLETLTFVRQQQTVFLDWEIYADIYIGESAHLINDFCSKVKDRLRWIKRSDEIWSFEEKHRLDRVLRLTRNPPIILKQQLFRVLI